MVNVILASSQLSGYVRQIKNGCRSMQELGELQTTEDGSATLVHPDHGEAYHSRIGAKSEAVALYVECSGLKEKLLNAEYKNPLAVLDVGLGLGYNALATIDQWYHSAAPADLNLFSIEINQDLFNAFQNETPASWQDEWSENWKSWPTQFCQTGPKEFKKTIPHPNQGTLSWYVWLGDARTDPSLESFLSQSQGFNYVWQDPFSPQKNQGMWNSSWFTKLKPFCQTDCQLMTYSVARCVKDALEDSGWHWQKIPATYPTKKNWLQASPSVFS